jgi:hypothetical protein
MAVTPEEQPPKSAAVRRGVATPLSTATSKIPRLEFVNRMSQALLVPLLGEALVAGTVVIDATPGRSLEWQRPPGMVELMAV